MPGDQRADLPRKADYLPAPRSCLCRSSGPEYGLKGLLVRVLEHLRPDQFTKVTGTLTADQHGQQIAAAWIGKEKLRDALSLRARIAGRGQEAHEVPPEPADRQPGRHPGGGDQRLVLRVPAIRVAEAREASGPGRTWMYRFGRPEPWDNHRPGACHGAEIPYVFGTITGTGPRPRPGGTPSQAVAGLAHQVWIDFITHGKPGWAPYGIVSRTTGLLTESITPVDDPAGDKRARWEGIRQCTFGPTVTAPISASSRHGGAGGAAGPGGRFWSAAGYPRPAPCRVPGFP